MGDLDIKPIKTEDTGQQDDEKLQGAVDVVASQELSNHIVGLHCNCPILSLVMQANLIYYYIGFYFAVLLATFQSFFLSMMRGHLGSFMAALQHLDIKLPKFHGLFLAHWELWLSNC